MYQPVALFIGLRYMRGRAADRFGRFVSWLSTIGITLGVMALVTVLSVMNGFERELQNNILGLMPQAILSSEHGSLNPQQLPETAVKLDGVNRVAPITTGDVVLQSARSVAVGVMLGIDPAQKDPLTPYLVNVKQTDLEPGKYNVILGEQLASQLGVNRGDQIRVMVPSASQLNNLMPIIGVLLDGAALPVAIEPLQVIVIALVAMAIALLSTLYPSWRAAATQPAEALRYE